MSTVTKVDHRSRLGAGAARWVGVVLVGLMVCLAVASPAGAEGSDAAPLGTARRVLVISVPTLMWSDVSKTSAPYLYRLAKQSAIADLSVRSVSRITTSTDGYATLNAGTRSHGAALAEVAFAASSSGTDADRTSDGDPVDAPSEVFVPDLISADDEAVGPLSGSPNESAEAAEVSDDVTRYTGTPAAEEFARRTGVDPKPGSLFNFGVVSLTNFNDALLYGSEMGALGDALADAGIGRAVIANGDHREGDTVVYRREATVALMDHHGLVPSGRVGASLLEPDPTAPYGVRLSISRVAKAASSLWADRSVLLVEASDLVRSESFKPLANERQQVAQRQAAIRRADALIGRLLKQVDPARDAIMVLSPSSVDNGTALGVMAIRAPGVTPGLLSSGTTRRAGFVQTVDVAPTILSLVKADVPSSMEGTPMEVGQSGGVFADHQDLLVQADLAAAFRDAVIAPVTLVFVLAQLALWGCAAYALARPPRGRLQGFVEGLTLSLLWFLPVTFLAGLVPFHRAGVGPFWAFLIAVPAALGVLTRRVVGRDLVGPLMLVLVSFVALFSVDIVLGARLQFNTVFGYTPTVAGRFAGMGNPAYAMFTSAGVLLAVLIAYKIPSYGKWLAAALLGWCVLVDAAPFWGSDVGGALSMIPAAGVVLWMLFGWRVRIRTVVLAIGVAVVVTTGFAAYDASRPPAERTHLGRLLADIEANGFSAFRTVVLRKLDLNLSVLFSSIWTLMVPVVFVSIAWLMWKAPGRLRTVAQSIPQERAAVTGLLVLMLLGFALNDSGITVPAIMLGVANAALIHLLMRVRPDSDVDLQSGPNPGLFGFGPGGQVQLPEPASAGVQVPRT